MVDFQNPLCLALIIENNLLTDRPQALLDLTSNPGKADDHYIALTLRVYRNKDNLTDFAGYITFRYNEVRWRPKTLERPKFSSIEFRNPSFDCYVPEKKFHFLPKKVDPKNPNYIKAETDATLAGITGDVTHSDYFAQKLGGYVLADVYRELLNLIDGKF